MEGHRSTGHHQGTHGRHHHLLHSETDHAGGGQSYPVVKAVTAATAGGSLLILSGLTLAVTVVGLTIATPLMVILSPVLVPAAITIALLIAGFLVSGGFGVAAFSILSWIYRYVTGKHPVMAETLDSAGMKMVATAKEVKGKAEQIGHQALGTTTPPPTTTHHHHQQQQST